MTENRIRELRKKKDLTQRALAEKAGTSQQQIQRIEAGVHAARFDLAARLATALGEPLDRVFPAAGEPLKQARRPRAQDGTLGGKLLDQLEEAGLDMDAEQWSVRYRLRGGAQGVLAISSGPEQRRLWRLLDPHNDEEGFMVFDAGARRYAINPVHLTFCHLCFDPPSNETEQTEEQGEDAYQARFWLADSAEPLTFGVEPDTASLDDDGADDGECQLQDLFYYAENGTETRLKLTDEDGEKAFFRVKDVAMFSVSLEAVVPKLRAAADDGREENEEVDGSK